MLASERRLGGRDQAGVEAGLQLRAFSARIGDVLFDLRHRFGVDQRALGDIRFQAGADLQRLDFSTSLSAKACSTAR